MNKKSNQKRNRKPIPDSSKKTIYQLPNGLSILQLNRYETDFVYQEVFEEQVYLKNGITIEKGDCVFDIGANIGLFSLFVLQKHSDIRLFAIEPSPELCEIIRFNTKQYDSKITIMQCGISNENKEAVFTYYPGYTILSGFQANPEEDFRTIKAGLGGPKPVVSEIENQCLDELVKNKIKEKREYQCQLRTISGIIAEQGIQTINLLKIDAEKSELEVLNGITEEDWPKIKQIVIEVHDLSGTARKEIESLLLGRGFNLKIEEEAQLNNSGIVNIYAIHSSKPALQAEPAPLEDFPTKNSPQILIAATFTADSLRTGLEFWRKEFDLALNVEFTPYNQVFQELLSPAGHFLGNAAGFNVIILKFDDWLRYLSDRKIGTVGDPETELTLIQQNHLRATFQEFTEALEVYTGHAPCFTLVLIVPPSLPWAELPEFNSLIADFETGLRKIGSEKSDWDLLKAVDYHQQYRVEEVYDEVGDELGHVPYTMEYFNFLATLIMRRYQAMKNNNYKVIALDCDHTLWEGVCGEAGPEGVKVTGLYQRFQHFLARKAEEGFLLSLCSKNNEEDVWEVFDRQKAMVLKREHLVDSRINWRPKSENIRSLAHVLNVGRESFVFIDDNPLECAEVRSNCPEVLTVQWPRSDSDASFLDHFWLLDKFSVTAEDKKRTDSYRANAAREKIREKSYDFQDFIKNLKLEVKITPVSGESLDRAAQLTNRTNQFNFTTIRRTPVEIKKLIEQKSYQCWVTEVSDRFGDYGIVGVIIIKIAPDTLELDTFLLSCRVLGRGVEYRMMSKLGEIAGKHGLSKVRLRYLKSVKNEPARTFLEEIGQSYPPRIADDLREYVIPAADLAKVAYQPLTAMELQSGVPSEIEPAQVDFAFVNSVRKREDLWVRITTKLNNVKNLSQEMELFLENPDRADEVESSAPSPFQDECHQAGEKNIQDLVLEKVKEVFGRVLKLPRETLDAQTEIENFMAKDSLKIVQLTSELNKDFPGIPPTILFEHRTLNSISESLASSHRDVFFAKPKVPSLPEKTAGDDDIAIIGLSGRFPGAETIDQFWENLHSGISSIAEVPKDRWEMENFYASNGGPGKSYCKWGGFISRIDCFEAPFFHISPKEAEMLDPQQRLFLEIVWGLLEDAGYTPRSLNRDTGVFVGVIASDYNTYTNAAALTGESPYRNSDYYQIPNRISYFFDLHGPSVAVDTACSGAGTALHLACQSLRQRECRTAIVGGTNMFIHPSRFIQYAQMQVLSHDGECRPFGAGATGTVYGEGVGALLIKPLTEAEKDGDHIYGVIKGSAINTGGKTNGFTVPNPMAQADVIAKALQDAGIDAGTVSYVEAHGTGTPLGDPIEIRGLTKAFQENMKFTSRNPNIQYCAIGSVKSNIGHLESGAAIAGIIKILLQMKHGLLVPSLNAQQLNPAIEFEKTPFYVQREVGEWKRPTVTSDGKITVFPRRAGISSFGAGGVNTHFLLEEYQSQVITEILPEKKPHIIVISAKNEGRLKITVKELVDFIRKNQSSLADLTDFAATLQLGRVSMEERLAVVVSEPGELIEKLSRYCEGQSDIGGLYLGNIKQKGSPASSTQENGKEGTGLAEKMWEPETLAEFWVTGGEIDWQLMYQGHLPRKISLPTYKFAGEPYWINNHPAGFSRGNHSFGSAKLHPFLDSNESTFYEQRFKKVLSVQDIFLKDHVVGGQTVLPGVAYFEMARVAGGLSEQGLEIRYLDNLVWVRPVILTESTHEIFVSLSPHPDRVECKAWSTGPGRQPLVHAEWSMCFGKEAPGEETEVMDLPALQKDCRNFLSRSGCYELLQKIGYQYGPSFQVIEELFFNERQALARLVLQEEPENGVVLHPALLDGALQTITGWISQVKDIPAHPYVPFTVGRVEIIKPLTRVCYALVSNSCSDQENTRLEKYDLRILSKNGEVLLKIRDYYPRPFLPAFSPANHYEENAEMPEMIFYQSKWEKSDLAPKPLPLVDGRYYLIFDTGDEFRRGLSAREIAGGGSNTFILVKPGQSYRKFDDGIYEINPESEEDYRTLFQSLNLQKKPSLKIIHNWSSRNVGLNPNQLNAQLYFGLYSILFLSKVLVEQHLANPVPIYFLYLHDRENPQPQYAAVSGMARSIRRENPKLDLKTIALSPALTGEEGMAETIGREILSDDDNIEILYEDGQRFQKKFAEFDFREFNRESATGNTGILRKNGIYLITGGTGGLGFLFAEYLAKQYQARLVLTGRSELDPSRKAKIRELESLGARVIYVQSNVAEREDVRVLIAKVKEEYQGLHGIIHCAGAIRDSLVINKTRPEVEAVIASKVWGTIHLDQETGPEQLDFFLMFSSTSSVAGHIGQSDYAYANRFLDEYAVVREGLREKRLRSGKTLVINWPWWQNGGMRLGEHTEKLLERLYGLKGLETEAGLAVFEKSLNSNFTQVIMVVGNRRKVEGLFTFTGSTALEKGISGSEGNPENQEEYGGKFKTDLSRIIIKILKLRPEEVDFERKLSEFGFDSISFTVFANQINEKFRLDISPASFYEYQTLNDFSAYVCGKNPQVIRDYYDLLQDRPLKAGLSPAVVLSTEKREWPDRFLRKTEWEDRWRKAPGAQQEVIDGPAREPIAVIGIGGIFPQSEDLEVFWDNLVHGRDLITEVPKERWNWEEYYGRPGDGPNKTDVKWGGFIKDVDKFDPLFFGISPREAGFMDPQQRIFLETVWKTIEDAGYRPSALAGSRTGLFVGVSINDYNELAQDYDIEINPFVSSGINNSIIANRISYLLDFHGPSEVIDTACSSSLVALRHAVDCLHKGECQLAIAGGVNIILRPKFQISFRLAGMLSPDGKCKTFDRKADGYVRGEGAGAILLKPLSRAKADGDHIYAVIRGIAENHGGRAQSLTAPNPKAQAELLVNAYRKASIPVNTVSYLETHGTGTSLGDPIEINALKLAFQRLNPDTGRRGYCGLGSLKTNIGHLEAASGIAGILKVILALKQKVIPASINFQHLNPYIDLEDSPFYIVSQTIPWEPLLDERNQRIPRRAGVSSFGFGGTNAHVILEEYEEPAVPVLTDERPQLFILSARTAEQLQEYVRKMVRFCEGNLLTVHETEKTSLQRETAPVDLAFTLQIGREPMNERLAVIASTIGEFHNRLRQYLHEEPGIENVFQGSVLSIKAQMNELITGKAGEEFIKILIRSNDLVRLAKLWVSGGEIDWRWLYQDQVPRRVSLPTYPFARERHWLTKSAQALRPVRAGEAETRRLHPLLGVNHSTINTLRFSTRLSGDEFFLTDHLIAGEKVLPGVTYLEMARAAAEFAAEKRVTGIKNIVWARPITVAGDPREVFINLYPQPEALVYEITTQDQSQAPVVHAQGKLVFEQDGQPDVNTEQRIDLDDIKKRCGEIGNRMDFYRSFEADGAKYGPKFQTVQELACNETEVLSRLCLPPELEDGFSDFVIHPSMLDGAFQSVTGLLTRQEMREGAPFLPFTLNEVEIWRQVPKDCYVYVTYADGKQSPNSPGLRSYTISLVDKTGRVLVRARNFSVRSIRESPEKDFQSKSDVGTVFYAYQWEPVSLDQTSPPGGTNLKNLMEIRGRVLIWEDEMGFSNAFERRWQHDPENETRVITVRPGEKYEYLADGVYLVNPRQPADFSLLTEDLQRRSQIPDYVIFYGPERGLEDYDNGWNALLETRIYPVFYLNQAFLKAKTKKGIQFCYLYHKFAPNLLSQSFYQAISGFAKSVHLENPKIDYKLIELSNSSSIQTAAAPEKWVDLLAKELGTGGGSEIRYRDDRRYTRVLKEFDLGREAENGRLSQTGITPKNNGVYLITGGTGGLGRIIANYLAQRVKAKLILSGRSALTAEKEKFLAQLKSFGADVIYVQADLAKRDETAELVAASKDRFQGINGIFHCAGVLRDGYLVNKTTGDFQAVMEPKIQGLLHLDELTKDENLDFLVLFSSISAVKGNTGQSDYAYANCFMDNFAEYRETLRAAKQRNGRTLAINWPFWRDGGMSLNQENQTFLAMTFGMTPLETGTGIRVLEQGLAQSRRQFLVVAGDRGKIKLWLEAAPENRDYPAAANQAPGDGDHQIIAGKFEKDLLDCLGDLLQIAPGKIKPEDDLSVLGLNSLIFVELANRINSRYGLEIMPSLFFEHATLGAIVSTLFNGYQTKIIKFYSEQMTSHRRTGNEIKIQESPQVEFQRWPLTTFRGVTRTFRGPATTVAREDIAIIGMSCVLPMSPDLDSFWNNLENGKDLVTEISQARWEDWGYQEEPVNDPAEICARWGGFLGGVDRFDAEFFNISMREAQLMDPQQRIFLEIVWKTIEDAGYKASELSGTNTGLFVGVANTDYYDVIRDCCDQMESHVPTGVEHSLLANRISYLLNFHGPSEPINTACSSSLVAIHRAVEALRTGRCHLAVAGGINIISSRAYYHSLSKAGVLSPDGRCRTFDRRANGYVRGEGAGAILLKRLTDAERDGDHIYALVKGIAINHGGHASSLTAPNARAQADLLLEAFADADLDPETISYLETHGTGTELGDPIEIEGLKKAFLESARRNGRTVIKNARIGIGTVKTNIGHLESAAGIAGVIKVLLAMKHRRLPGNLHLREINPYIRLEKSPFFIVDQAIPWETPLDAENNPVPRRAGVSSFGFGGVNAHVILEEYSREPHGPGRSTPGPQLIVLSARNKERLTAYAGKLADYLAGSQRSSTQAGASQSREFKASGGETVNSSLAEISFTLQTGREPMTERVAFLVSDLGELKKKLHLYCQGESNMENFFQGSTAAKKPDSGWITGEEGAAFIQKAVENHNLGKIAQLWVTGQEIDWRLLYNHRSPRRVPLPTYPFAGKRYWFDSKKIGVRSNSRTGTVPGPTAQIGASPQTVVFRETTDLKKRQSVKLTLQAPTILNYEERRVKPGAKIELPAKPVQSRALTDHYALSSQEEKLEGTLKLEDEGENWNVIKEKVKNWLAAVVYKDPWDIEDDRSFLDLGLDSILAIELVNKLNKELPVSLKTNQLYSYPTVRQLSFFLQKLIRNKMTPESLEETSLPASLVVRLAPPETKISLPVAADVETVQDDRVGEKIKKLLAGVLYLDNFNFDEDQPLLNLGLDSILAIELVKKLNESFQVNLKTSHLYSYPTVGKLIAYLKTITGDRNEQLCGTPRNGTVLPSETPMKSKKPETFDQTVAVATALPEIAAIGEKTTGGIAIIGFSGRFPGADNPDQFWNNLINGVESVTEVPADRWDVNRYFDPEPRAPYQIYNKWGGFLEEADRFDPLFFGITPLEAEIMDPQQRLVLEEAWRAIEDAGYSDREMDNKRCGVIIGVAGNDYLNHLLETEVEFPAQAVGANAASILASRIAYHLNLRGTSFSIDAACSSSLVAVNLACEKILNRSMDMALAGGVNVLNTPYAHLVLSKANMLSHSAQIKPFDDRADGFVLGEAIGIVVLKALEQAERDGDHIYGVIKAVGVNQNGRSNGIVAPNALAQAELIREVYQKAKIDPSTISLVEAHGTGSQLGDSIEVAALEEVFQDSTKETGFCALGAVKANVGHALAASGIVSLIKVLLCIKHQKIPPTLHFQIPNHEIQFSGGPFYINSELRNWTPLKGIRRAAVNTFGINGTNAHLVIEEPPRPITQKELARKPSYLIILSAKTETALNRKITEMAEWLEKQGGKSSIGDLAYTLLVGRTQFPVRLALVVRDLPDFQRKIRKIIETGRAEDMWRNNLEEGSSRNDPDSFKHGERVLNEIRGNGHYKDDKYRGKLRELAEFFVNGIKLDWDLLYRASGYRRISLPAYPFEKERYRVAPSRNQILVRGGRERLHPLIDSNESTLTAFCFKKEFTGEEFYLRDHQAGKTKILPGVVYLEMARAAGSLAYRESKVRKLKNVTWARPLSVIESPRTVFLNLYPDQGEVGFEIYTYGADQEKVWHVRGSLIYENDRQVNTERIGIAEITKHALEKKSRAEFYQLIQASGMCFGPAFQAIQELYRTESGVLSRFELPIQLDPDFNTFVLHPTLVDASIQTGIGLKTDQTLLDNPPELPFMLGELEIIRPLSKACYALVTFAGNTAESNSQIRKLDIIITDETGEVLVKMKNYYGRPIRNLLGTGVKLAPDQAEAVNESSSNGEINQTSDDDPQAENEGDLLERTENFLKEIFSKVTKLPPEKIRSKDRFEKYGIDSLMILNLNNEMGHFFGGLSKTLFFEYQTLRELAGYFLKNHREKILGKIGAAQDNHAEKNPVKYTAVDNQAFSRPFFLKTTDLAAEEDIAIIGIGGQYPMARSLEEFWDNLLSGKDSVTIIPEQRWDYRKFYDPDPEKANEGKIYCKWGAFLDDVDKFDPLFFNISPAEAETMDPQERLLLQVAWSTLEDSGYTREYLKKIASKGQGSDVGVYIGSTSNTYLLFGPEESVKGNFITPGTYPWSLANRISYLFNFNGPSFTVDTGCSSALVAIHLACESLKKGECRYALAGGVNLYLHHAKYNRLCLWRMLSPTGKCHSFGEGADGFVPGEGVGLILLKPLAAAVRERDRIYAVIKATALNHDGRTNGYTVPSPNAQADVILECLQKAKFDPRTISYIETHGTGTLLGDPIELTGLTKAFREKTPDRQFCAIGSLKSNLGHMEGASGIGGLTKIVLQMKYRQIVPSLHAARLNPNLDFAESPFYVQQEPAEWKQPVITVDGQERIYPRRAGLSSFGAGGANAHILLEEYQNPAPRALVEENGPYVLVVSAKNEERLLAYAGELLNYLEKKDSMVNLNDLAYTLQVGREGMEERLATVVSHLSEFIERLQEYCRGNKVNFFSGNIYPGKLQYELLTEGAEGENFLKTVIRVKNLTKLAQLWTLGFTVDWELLYPAEKPRRISLPSYPFAKETYWITLTEDTLPIQGKPHPMIDSNSSVFNEERFSICFVGNEFYLADHVVAEEKILPGVAYIEMARAAGEIAGEMPVIKIRDLVWITPLVVAGTPREARISLFPTKDLVDFMIYTLEEEGRRVIHAQGKLVYADHWPKKIEKQMDVINIEAIHKRCPYSMGSREWYQIFEKLGFKFGPAFRPLNTIFYNKNEALSRLEFPPNLHSGSKDFVLHPSLMDGALQTVLGLMEPETLGDPLLPFSLEEVEVFAPLPKLCYAYATSAGNQAASASTIKKFDILLLDSQGNLCVSLRSFSLRAMGKNVPEERESRTVLPEDEIMDLFRSVAAGSITAAEANRLMEGKK